MPEIPSIIPLILTGILVGLAFRKTTARIGWRLAILGSLLGGLSNLAYAAVLPVFRSQEVRQAIGPPSFVRQAASSPLLFLAASFIVGVVIVLMVLAGASLTLRLFGRKAVED
jgi:cytochrome bd-type quinol oxidase subunit 2